MSRNPDILSEIHCTAERSIIRRASVMTVEVPTRLTQVKMLSGMSEIMPQGERWSRLSEQIFRVDKWNLCRG